MHRSLFPFLFLLLGILPVIIVSHGIARAEGIRLFSELELSQVESELIRKDTGQTTKSDSTNFNQNYNLNVSRTVYPYLNFQGGGIFQLDSSDSTTDGIDTDREKRTIQPFFEVNLNNPIYGAGLGYRRGEIKDSGSGISSTKDIREEYNARLVWRPVDLPRIDLRYTRTQASDEPETMDSVDNLFALDSRYEFKGLRLYYSYTRDENQDKVTDIELLREVHQGSVDYSRRSSRNRLLVATGYRINYSTTEVSGSGGGAIIPVLRFAGVFSLDDTPEDGPSLASNVALIDGNLTVSAGIDIGLAGDRTTQTNIGLDFGFPTEVDTIFLWVDRSLPSSVAGSFSWTIYTSPDNDDASTWSLHAVVFPATFGTFENRFEINFPLVETRFLKVVTRPLSPAVVGAASFPNIFITEMEAFTRIPGQEGSGVSATDQASYLNLKWKFTDRTSMGYNVSFRYRESDPSTVRRTSLSNSVDLTHFFSDIFTGNARLSRSDASTRGTTSETSVNYSYSASLRASYIDTFSQILTYSGTHVTEEDGTSNSNSIFLRNNAQLYTDWSAYLDLGYTSTEAQEGERTTSAFTRVGTNLMPNRKVTVNINYSVTNIRISGAGEESSRLKQEGDVQIFMTPFATVSLFGGLRLIKEEDSSRTAQDYSVNWSPFPEGTLQLFFIYSESLRSENDQKSTTLGPSLRWKITGYAFLDISYTVSETDDRIEKLKNKNFRSNIKLIF